MSDTTPSPLSQTQAAQRAELFELLVERATDFAIILLDPQGMVASWNDGARRVLGYEAEEILGQSQARFYTHEDVEAGIPERQLKQAREQGRADNERWQMKKDGSLFYASGVAQVLTDEAGNVRGYSLIFRDQTRQQQMEEALRHSEERYRRTVESVTEYAIFTLDARGNVSEWNTGAERLLGYQEEDILGQSALMLFTPEDVARGDAQKELEQATREGRAADERWHVKQDGTRFWASGVLMLTHNGEQHRFIKVMRDMTASKQAEARRQALEHETTLLQERTRIGQELHDTLAQAFTAVKLQLDAAEDALYTAPAEAEGYLARARQVAEESLQETRRVVRALRTAAIEFGGLLTAVEHMVEQATQGTGIDVHWQVQGTVYRLPDSIENELYRMVQEALTNALRHAQARTIDITLSYTPTEVRLRVADDGHGFDTQAQPSGYGLSGMRERAQRIGAEFVLISAPGQGAQLQFLLPTTAFPTFSSS